MKKLICLFVLLFVPSTVFAGEIPTFFGPEVVVTASKRLELRSQTFANVEVISAEDIKSSGAKTVSDALRNLSDVYVKSNGGLGGVTTIKLKSTSSEQVLILIDGYRINSTLLGMADVGDIPANNIERIEVVGEAVSAIYGADAMGGVVNIITKKKSENPVSAEIKYGTYGETNANGSVNGNLGKVSYFLTGNYLKSDGFRQNSDFNSKKYSINLNFSDIASLNYINTISDRGNPGVPRSDTDPTSASTLSDRQVDLSSNLLFAVNGKILNTNNKLSIFQNISDQRAHYEDSFTPGLFVDDKYLSKITGAEYQNETQLNKHGVITSGLEWKRNTGQSSKAGDVSLDNTSIYVNAEAGLGLPMSANLGVRADQNPTWGTVFNPRVGALINFGDNTILKSSVASGFRAPTINELYWNDPTYGTYGNTSLVPEKSNNFNISLGKDSENTSMLINYYLNRVTNMIKWSQTGAFSWQPVNIDSAKIEGIGLEVKKQLLGDIYGYANYNCENSINNTTGKVIIYSPQQKVSTGLLYKKDFASIKLNLRSVSQVYTDSANTKTLPAYSVVDLVFLNKIKIVNLSLSIFNLFNETYFESVGFSPVDWKERGYPMPGRRFEIGISI